MTNNDSPVDLILTQKRAEAMQSTAQALYASMGERPDWTQAVYQYARTADGIVENVVVHLEDESTEVLDPSPDLRQEATFARLAFRLEEPDAAIEGMVVAVGADLQVNFHPEYGFPVRLVIPN